MTETDTFDTLTDQNWEKDVLGSPKPVLVDFWADWCQPCKALVPALEAVAAHFAGRLKVGTMNVEENNDVPYKYNINRLPTLLVIKGGQVSEQRVGLISKEELIKLLGPHIS
jgi:thioredoxin 1